MVAGPASPNDPAPPVGPTMVPMQSTSVMVSDSFAKDAIISWFHGEFAAIAIIRQGSQLRNLSRPEKAKCYA
ncbi:RNA demethylase ALKBH10B-like [Senna tora]|uniref:RNA demethylase ALKBH10B-like n=1 Tax=Senna tora TaxID=362788 RepID=A0A835CH87_9FABA|nr:RNA demethylase ALKBH10B-like [Senna tora]